MKIDAYLGKADNNNEQPQGKQQQLLSFQFEAIDAITLALEQERRRILIQLPPGAGRTVILKSLLKSDLIVESSILILVQSASEKAQFLDALSIYISRPTKKILYPRVTVHTISDFRKKLNNNEMDSDYSIVFTIGIALDPELKLLLALNTNDQNKSIIISFVSFATPLDIENYGEPVFSYSLSDGIRDKIFISVQYHAGSKLESVTFANSRQLSSTLEPFIIDFSADTGRNAMMLCPSKEAVEALMKSLMELRLQAEIRTDEGIADEAWSAFNKSNRKTSFIIITSRTNLTGIDFPYLTDIVLLRSIGKKMSFDNILSRVMRQAEGKQAAHLWDFGDNQRYFDRSLGQVITKGQDKNESADGWDDAIKIENVFDESPQVVQQFIAPVGDNVSKEDLLGRTRLLHVLKGLIQDTRSARDFRPFVVGLFGKWGAGKSTVVHLLENEFKKDKQFCFISFNAWQNEHCTHMGAALAHRIVAKLYQEKSATKRILLSLFHNVFLKRDEIAITMLGTGVLSLLAAIFITGDQVDKLLQDERWPVFLRNNSFLTFFSGFLLLTGSALLTSYLKHPFTSKIKKVISKPDYSAHLGISEQIKQEISALFRVRSYTLWNILKREQPNRQFIVVIDDLDRCNDSKIVEVLEAIRLIIDLPNVVVMLTVDQNILLSAVANKYSQQNKNLSWEQALSIARDFLGKIIQISIELDSPDASQARRFVAKRLYVDAADIETVHKNILENKKVNQAEAKNAEDAREMLNLSLKDMFGEDNDLKEDVEDDMQTSNDYLKSTAGEAETFSKCVGAFDIANPRTLVRIHNTITLLKGLHPDIVSDKKKLDLHIYLAFLQECYAMRARTEQATLEGLFDVSFNGSGSYVINLRRLGDQLQIRIGKKDICTAANRIRRLSLPSVNNLIGTMPIMQQAKD